MAQLSTIEWTDSSWNIIRGCKKISPGCKHCYAERFAERWRGIEGHAFELGFEPRLVPEMLTAPLRWVRPRKIFVNSMSDVFLESVPVSYIALICEVMQQASWHTFQVLTKRADRMKELLSGELAWAAELDNVLWGVSVEDQRYGLPRLKALRATPARRRFLSIEPLLEDLGALDLSGIDWAIVGGESGPGARPMKAAWVRSIRAACAQHEVPFFFKQWGGVQKKKAGRLLDGRDYGAMPKLKTGPVLSRKKRRARIDQVDTKAKAFEPLIRIGRRAQQDRAVMALEDRTLPSPAQLDLFGGRS